MSAIAVGVALAVTGLTGLVLLGERTHRCRLARLAQRRPSPSRDHFCVLLAPDCADDVALWLHAELAPYWSPLSPHPDDDFIRDLGVDPDEPEDWLIRFCRAHALDVDRVVPWPEDRATTVRNFARWLAEERGGLVPAAPAPPSGPYHS